MKSLTSSQVDLLLRASQQGRGATAREKQAAEVTPWNYRQAGQIGRDQVKAVNLLHETFARHLTDALGAYLRVLFEVNLVSVEQLSFAEFLQRIPEVTYLASVNLTPLQATAALQMDLSLAYPVIDLLLGGQGQAEIGGRDITEIEEQVLESVVRIICRELQTVWQPVLKVHVEFDQRQQLAQVIQLMPPNEKVLCLSFEVRMKGARGALLAVFPAVVSSALLRKLSQQRYYRRRRGTGEYHPGLRERLLAGSFPVALVLPPTPLPVQDLLGLEPGHVLVFTQSVREPALLVAGGRALCTAFPVRANGRRSARVQSRLSTAEAPERN